MRGSENTMLSSTTYFTLGLCDWVLLVHLQQLSTEVSNEVIVLNEVFFSKISNETLIVVYGNRNNTLLNVLNERFWNFLS